MLNVEIAPGVVTVRPENGNNLWGEGLLHDIHQSVTVFNGSARLLAQKILSEANWQTGQVDSEALLLQSGYLYLLFKQARIRVKQEQKEPDPDVSTGNGVDPVLVSIFQDMKVVFERLPEADQFSEINGLDETKALYAQSREQLGIFLESALAYSENREYRPQFVPVGLHGFLADLLAVNFPDETGNSRLTLACPQKQQAILETAVTDPQLLTTILANLVSNGIKYSDPEDGPVKIRYRRVDGQLEISVRDYGIGLTAGEIGAVMDDSRAYRTSLARKKAPGSGIGLSFCIRLLRMAGGEIKITSRGRHRGTRVRVRLPAEFS